MFIKYLVGPLSIVFVLGGCSNGGTSSGGVETAPLTYDQVNTIVQNQNNPEVVRQADFDEKVKYAWAKCKVQYVYVYVSKTVVYTSGCLSGAKYFTATKVSDRISLAAVASQAKEKNWKLWFSVNAAGTKWTYFVS